MQGAFMPKTPVDEDRNPCGPNHDIGSSAAIGQRRTINSIANTGPMELASDF
jgi:hypothetical protein